jgi:hypothetical protein
MTMRPGFATWKECNMQWIVDRLREPSTWAAAGAVAAAVGQGLEFGPWGGLLAGLGLVLGERGRR